MKTFITTHSSDPSVDIVMDWISYFGHFPQRYNVDEGNNNSVSFEFGNDLNRTVINETEIQTDDSQAIWLRKFRAPESIDKIQKDEISNIQQAGSYLKREFFLGNYAMFDSWKDTPIYLGARMSNQPSKMEMLICAKSLNIDIPDTLVTNRKSALLQFMEKHPQVITKSISDSTTFLKNNIESDSSYGSIFTELLTEELIGKIPKTFFLSLFQEALNKEFEIRTFFLDGKCYSMAIFSQSDKQTKVDFRMYNDLKMNRNVPYKLPQILESKIIRMMNKLKLKTGSLDFVKTRNGRVVFLEVNPWGQFGMVSDPCNYHLDEKIARALIKSPETIDG